MSTPCPLYKYMKLEHAMGLVRKGILRIGTLYDFKNHEKYGPSVGDKDEGKRITYSEDETDLSRPETVSPFLRKHIRAEEGKYWKLSNIRSQVTDKSQNYYIFSVSEEYSHDIMRRMGYDSCVRIDEPEMFFGTIGGWLYKEGKFKEKGFIAARCVYEDRSQHYSKTNRPHPAVLKDPRYSYQKEIRAIWTPSTSEIEPFNIQCYQAREYCHIIEGKVPMITGKIIDQKVDGKDVLVDGAFIDNSTLTNCKLIFQGAKPFRAENSSFIDCDWAIEGYAALTVDVLKALYSAGGSAQQKVDQIVEHIKGDAPPEILRSGPIHTQ